GGRAIAVGNVRGIGEVEQGGAWQQAADAARDGQAAHTAVAHTDFYGRQAGRDSAQGDITISGLGSNGSSAAISPSNSTGLPSTRNCTFLVSGTEAVTE